MLCYVRNQDGINKMENTRFVLSFLPADNQNKGLFLLVRTARLLRLYNMDDRQVQMPQAPARREGLHQGAA